MIIEVALPQGICATCYLLWPSGIAGWPFLCRQPEFLRSSRAARLKGRFDRTVTMNQDVRFYGKKGDRFTAGGWCKSFAKKVDVAGYVFCSLSVYFNSGDSWNSGGHVHFNYGEDGWQFASGSIVAPNSYNTIRFTLYMNRQMNHADFTGLYLYPEAFGTDYVYDAKGNRTAAKQPFGGQTAAEYDDANNLTRYTAPGRTLSSTFSYGATEAQQKKHLLLEAHSPLGTDGYFTYDDFGNATRSDASGTVDDVTAITRSTAEYQHNSNYLHKQTDARGKTVTTEVDANKGTTTRVTDPKGQAVAYEHDALRRVVKVSTEAGEKAYRNEYVYHQQTGQLVTVKHNTDASTANDVAYTFEYDALGRKTKVNVGNVMLSRNVYQNNPEQDHYGTLAQMEYGNGTVVKNEYDDFNRVTGVVYGTKSEGAENATFEDTPRYEYAYNANGQVAHVRNNLLGRTTESEYDLANRPCLVKVHTDDGTHVYTGEVAYDDVHGNLSEFKETVGETRTEYSTTFGYDEENRPTSLNYGSHGQTTLTYDKLGRVRQSSVKAGSGAAMTTTYAFELGGHGENSTTGLVKSISQTGGNFAYTYDDNGNITSVVQDGITTSYTYDALGQLIRVDDGQENATWEYSYDQGGNILSKKKFVNGVETESTDFEYTNENWRDQLTKVNGTTITYDAIGNPLNDGEWTYTWQNGRQLASMTNGETTASFVYNENGLRVQKTINGVVTKYTLHGKNVVHLTCGNDELHFFYDASNKPAVVVYNGMPYSYVKNLQGDIVAILDANGTVVVRYVYDAWGRPISKTGSMAATLGSVQPFRYRGYAYDEEIDLYYLRSRYYIPGACRFLNVDSQMSGERKIGKSSLYVFCSDNPIVMVDPNGTSDTPAMDENDPRYRLAMFMLSSYEWRSEETFDDYSWGFSGLCEVRVSHTVGAAHTLGNTREDGLFLVGGRNCHMGQGEDWIYGVVAYGGQMDAILGVTITGTSLSLEVGCMDRSAMITVGYTANGFFSTFDISAEYTIYGENGSYNKSTVTFSVNAWVAVLAVAVVALCPVSWGAVAPAVPAIGAMI